MSKTKRFGGKLGIALCCALLRATAYGQPSVSVGVSVPLPAVEVVISAESDFYEPLTPHGEWVVVGSYGRCWRPGHVASGWRPYCSGNWQRTEAGWYWVSDEPWAWATYHYGRWDFTDQYGWYWVPQIQWAPAWVSWHEGGGYVGWAPLQPSVSISASGFVGFNAALIAPRAFVFVEQRRFLSPISPTMVVANNTTIINKTVNITNTKIVNNTVINEGPATAAIEKASGQKVQAVPVRELRHKQEAALAARQKTPTATSEKKVQPAAPSEPGLVREKTATAPKSTAVERPVATPKSNEASGEKLKPVPPAPEFKPKPGPEGNPAAAKKQPTESKEDRRGEKPQNPPKPSDQNEPRPDKEKPPATEKDGANPADKGHEKKPRE